jgi:aspartate/methionine/tyrosine aminotransferase
MTIPNYTIQDWLFNVADGKFDIDLGESGIQFHHLHDLDLSENCHLNYEQDRGDIATRKVIASLYGLTAQDITITHGSQEALYLLYNSVLGAGDHVIATVPGWQQSWAIPEYLGCCVDKLRLSPQDNYDLDLDEVDRLINHRTKMIIITNPNNPTAVSFGFEKLTKLCKLAHAKEILVVADEEYFTDYKNSLVKHFANAVAVHSLSKVYGFPGLRLGFLISTNRNITEAVVNFKRYTTVSNSSLCTKLAQQVFDKHQLYLQKYREMCSTGLKILQDELKEITSFEIVPSHNMPFVYIKTPTINSANFAKQLLEDFRTLIMPAEVFDDQQSIRVSIARPSSILSAGLNNIKTCLANF